MILTINFKKMIILVLNCGSSSIKYKLFENEKVLTFGLIEKIGEPNSKIKNHSQGIKLMMTQLLKSKQIKNISDIKAIGHRVVHGGQLAKSCLINNKFSLC